mgnify:CR=1 FL=1
MNKFTRLLYVFLVMVVTSSLSVQSQELKKVDKFFKTEYYKDEEHISKKDFINNLQTNQESYNHWKKSRTYNTLAWISIASEWGFATWILTDGKRKNSTANTGLYSSLALGLLFNFISERQTEKSIEKYNKGVKNDKKITFKPSQKGLGIVMTF